MTGVLRCPTNHHTMIQVSPNLWLCEDYATGDAKCYVGIVSDARAMVAREGGVQAIRDRTKAKNRAKRLANKAKREEIKEVYDRTGYYKSVSYEQAMECRQTGT